MWSLVCCISMTIKNYFSLNEFLFWATLLHSQLRARKLKHNFHFESNWRYNSLWPLEQSLTTQMCHHTTSKVMALISILQFCWQVQPKPQRPTVLPPAQTEQLAEVKALEMRHTWWGNISALSFSAPHSLAQIKTCSILYFSIESARWHL